jgi:hypothetical protein
MEKNSFKRQISVTSKIADKIKMDTIELVVLDPQQPLNFPQGFIYVAHK